MPLNANGKLDRARLPEPLSTRRTDAGEMSDTERDLALLWGDVLGIDGQLGPDDDFFEIGGDSLLAFTLFDRIADQFARDVPINSLVEASTVRALAQVIDSGAVERRRLARLNKAGARIPLFYVHSGAGGMLTLRNFSTAVGTDQPLFGLQAFSDRDIEVQDTLSVVETSDECLAALRELQPKGPYLLAGHSIGGHIAYEMANRLHADGERVAYVGMLDPAAPHTLSLRGRLTARAKELTGRGPEPRRENLFRTVIAATGRMMRARVTAAAPATEEDREQADTDRWMRNLLLIEQRYDPPMWSGNVTLYVTSEMARYTGSPTNGWARYVEGSLEVRRVPGGHLSMLLEPNVGVVARSMAADIDAVQLTLG
jgi:thioesterase domain-containing protein/acyl carrier protein